MALLGISGDIYRICVVGHGRGSRVHHTVFTFMTIAVKTLVDGQHRRYWQIFCLVVLGRHSYHSWQRFEFLTFGLKPASRSQTGGQNSRLPAFIETPAVGMIVARHNNIWLTLMVMVKYMLGLP